jgi:predicted component of type VI protein secretion system
MPAAPEPDSYLWSNPAFTCAQLLGATFLERGWDLELGEALELDELPAHVRQTEGEAELQPCAEARLSQRAAEAILERGIMPLVASRDRAAVRLLRLQSLASPPQRLAGRWA